MILRWGHTGLFGRALNPMTRVRVREKESEDLSWRKGESCVDRGKDWRDAATIQGMPGGTNRWKRPERSMLPPPRAFNIYPLFQGFPSHLGHFRVLKRVPCALQTGSHPLSIFYLVVYICQSQSPNSSHPIPRLDIFDCCFCSSSFKQKYPWMPEV